MQQISLRNIYSLSQNAFNDQNIIYHPLRNYHDVSVLEEMVSQHAPWCSGFALGFKWVLEVGLLGLGGRARLQRQDLFQRRRQSHPQLLVCGDWAHG